MLRPPAWFVGEFVGTFLLVFFGCGSVATATLTGAQVGGFQIAIVWGIGVAVAIHLTAALSGAHLNPAVTVALAAWRGFAWRRVPAYCAAQFMGAFAAAAVLHAVFAGPLIAYEWEHGLVRGAPGSEATAMIFSEFFPNPDGRPLDDATRTRVSLAGALVAEGGGTAVLVLVILALTDGRNGARPRELAPVLIGLTLTALISLAGPLTMAAFNPARDLAPRLWSALAGWNGVPFTANGPAGWLAVYVVAPLFGGLIGGALWRGLLTSGYAASGAPAGADGG